MPYLRIFGSEFKKTIVMFEISTIKFREKMKVPKFGTKSALFGYFWAGI